MGFQCIYFLVLVRQVSLFFVTSLAKLCRCHGCHAWCVRSHFAVESINDVARITLTQNLIKNLLCFECCVGKGETRCFEALFSEN